MDVSVSELLSRAARDTPGADKVSTALSRTAIAAWLPYCVASQRAVRSAREWGLCLLQTCAGNSRCRCGARTKCN